MAPVIQGDDHPYIVSSNAHEVEQASIFLVFRRQVDEDGRNDKGYRQNISYAAAGAVRLRNTYVVSSQQ
jgi:hypothetical protein